MSEPKRQLAAIMFTDIAGYTKLMGEDEHGALELLRRNRDIHFRLIEKYNGTLIKEMGDGNLVQFSSASDAIQCAYEIQIEARQELDGLIRIGIHLGEITIENSDVFGDGVNIASRIQSIADPGGIYVSETVQKSIKSKSAIQTLYLGEFTLRNVDYPIKTYAIQGENLPIPPKAKIKKLASSGKVRPVYKSPKLYFVFLAILTIAAAWYLNHKDIDGTGISSLVFLPFDNYTGTDTLEYMIAGMHDALIGEVGKISSLRVPGARTANVYKGSQKSIPEIASELKVDAGVETSVSCYGETICFRVKIVSAFPVEKQIWVKDYNVNRNQIQNFYRKLAIEISRELSVTMTSSEETLLASADSIDALAYEMYMKGRFYLNQINDESLKNAEEYFKLASNIEPQWALPYLALAEVAGYQRQMAFKPSSVLLPVIRENLDKAIQLDSNSAATHYVAAVHAVWTEFNWEKGEKEFRKSLELNPNYAYARIFYSHLLMILRRTDEALSMAKSAEELEPLDPFIQGLYADVLRRVGDCEAAKSHAEKGLSIEPNHYFVLGELSSIYPCLGEYEKAFQIRKNHPLWKKYGLANFMDSIFRKNDWTALIKEEIKFIEKNLDQEERGNGLPARYLEIGNSEKALDYMYQLYEMRSPGVPYFSAIDNFQDLKDNPRYIKLLEQLNLPTD